MAAGRVLIAGPRRTVPPRQQTGRFSKRKRIRQNKLPRVLVAIGDRGERARVRVVHDELALIEDVVHVELNAPAHLPLENRKRIAELEIVNVLVLRIDGAHFVDGAAVPGVGVVGARREAIVGARAGDATDAADL